MDSCAYRQMRIGIRLDFHTRISALTQPHAGPVLWVLGTSVFAGVVHSAAVTEGFEKAAVASITWVATGHLVSQAWLLVWNTAVWWTCASPLELYYICHFLWVLIIGNRIQHQLFLDWIDSKLYCVYCRTWILHSDVREKRGMCPPQDRMRDLHAVSADQTWCHPDGAETQPAEDHDTQHDHWVTNASSTLSANWLSAGLRCGFRVNV